MKRKVLLAALLFSGSFAHATIVVSDNFDSGSLAGWSQKWTATMNSKFSNTGTNVVMDGTATAQYRVINTTGFSLSAGETATISSDFRMDHTGVDPTKVNGDFIGFLLTDTTTWYDGANMTSDIANRKGAVGDTLPFAPWVENWIGWGNFGINNGVGGVGNWFSMDMNLSVSNGTYWSSMDINHGGGTTTTSLKDLGIAAGTTVYAGYTTAYNNSGTNIMVSASMNKVEMDNFQVDVIPEPATIGLVAAFGGAVLFIRRRFMM